MVIRIFILFFLFCISCNSVPEIKQKPGYRTNSKCIDKDFQIDSLNRYKINQPYRISRQNQKDSTVITFRMFEDCSQKFGGYYEIENDTMNIFYLSLDSLRSTCYCDYKIEFHFNNTGLKKFSAIKVKEGDYNNPRK